MAKSTLPMLLAAGAALLFLGTRSEAKAGGSLRGQPAAPGVMPESLQRAYLLALMASYDPDQIDATAETLEHNGFLYEADALRQKATAIDGMSDQEYIDFVSCLLRANGAVPGSVATVQFKRDPSTTVEVVVATDAECQALRQEIS